MPQRLINMTTFFKDDKTFTNSLSITMMTTITYLQKPTTLLLDINAKRRNRVPYKWGAL